MHPRHWAEACPDKPAVIAVTAGETISYRELNDRSIQCANLIRQAGLEPGDHVAAIMENHPRFFEISWAAQRSGLYFTAIPWRFKPEEIAYILEHSGAKVLFTSNTQQALCQKLESSTRDLSCFMVGGKSPGYANYEKAIAGQPTTPTAKESRGVDMLYSSGSTGKPKAIKIPIETAAIDEPTALYAFFGERYQWDEQTRYLISAPLYHSGPLRFSMAQHYFGGTVVMTEKFDAEQNLALIQQYQVSHAHWVPTMMVRILKLPELVRRAYDVSSLRFVMSGAAPISVSTKQTMIDWLGPILEEAYAGTEGNGSTMISSREWMQHPGSVGKAVGCTVHIVDDNDHELPAGEIGTIYFDGPKFEYYKDPVKTEEAYNDLGWSTLGDIGYLDKEGYLYLTDRKNDVVIINGVNVYPLQAEQLLINHPQVTDAAVFGLPDEDSGERLHAVVQLADGEQPGEALSAKLIDYCRAELATIKCPRSLDFCQQIPRHETGKLYKRLLKAEYVQEQQ
jgi:acyl-coenzyme A synthetase/AMP-(fatty) acid ligase